MSSAQVRLCEATTFFGLVANDGRSSRDRPKSTTALRHLAFGASMLPPVLRSERAGCGHSMVTLSRWPNSPITRTHFASIEWRRWESNSRLFTWFRRFSNGFADRYRSKHVQRTRTKRATGHSYDNVTNPGCESGACGGRRDVLGVRCVPARALASERDVERRLEATVRAPVLVQEHAHLGDLAHDQRRACWQSSPRSR